MFLVDTNVVSAGAPGRPRQFEKVLTWLEDRTDALCLSAMTVAEVQSGIAKLEREKAKRRAAQLTSWLEAVIHLYGDRVLAFDLETARIAGALADRAQGLGRHPGLADIIIAATASRHHLTILTRNARHFEPLGIPVTDPFLALPDKL